ncbi:MAG: sulfotransferase [Rubrobacteraceae bacterium]
MEEQHTPEQGPHPVPIEDSRVESPGFFVVGHARSGTTWLERVINSHPEVLCKGGGMFFGRDVNPSEVHRTLPTALSGCEDLKTWYGMRVNGWGERPFEEALPGMVRALIDHISGTELARSGKRIVGDRTPHYVSCLEEIHELYPEAKIIHAVRDGRDAVISGMHNFWHHSRDRGGHISLEPEEIEIRDAYFEDREAFLSDGQSIFTEKRLLQRARRWNHTVGQGRRTGMELFGDNYLDFRYEDHLHQPHEALAKLFGFLEVGTDPHTIERAIEENRFEKLTGRAPGQELSGNHARKGVAGDWKELFTGRDKRIFEEEAGDLLIQLGYERHLNW